MRIYRNFPLSKILYYRIGGRAQFVIKIENKEDLLEALGFVKKNKIKRVMPIGLGSNLLISDKFFDGAVLWFSKGESSAIKLNDENLISAFASESLDDLIKFSFDNNLIGLEWAGGLPSSIGGAVRGNSGAFGGEIAGSLERIEVFEIGANGESVHKILKASELEFGYRESVFKKHKNWIIGNCYFKLNTAKNRSLAKVKDEYSSHIDYRNKNHPTEFPSCGSVFKNIRQKEKVDKILDIWQDAKFLSDDKWYGKISMGYVINRLGFSGYKVGGAEVAKKHANYILNIDNAKFNDVCSIIEKIKEKFYKTFGFSPEVEVEIVHSYTSEESIRPPPR